MSLPKGTRSLLQPVIVRLYTEKRYTIQRIAEKLDVSPGTVRNVLHDARVETRGPGGLRLPKGARSRLQPVIVRLYTEQRYSVRRIAQDLSISYGTVHNVLREAQVALRPSGGSRPDPAAGQADQTNGP